MAQMAGKMDELRKIRLTGDYLSLNILERIFANEDLTVFSEIHCNQKMYYMKSSSFENLDEKELRKEGEKLLKKINSTFSFAKENYIPVKIEDVYIGDCGYMTFEDHITLRDDLCLVENGKEKDLDEDVILDIFAKMKNDDLLHQILTLSLEKGKDWVNLCRILELFEAHHINIVNRKWITETALGSLKHTANSPGAIGNEARHGSQSGDPPSNPMPLNRAQSLVDSVIRQYINSLR